MLTFVQLIEIHRSSVKPKPRYASGTVHGNGRDNPASFLMFYLAGK